MEKANNDIKVVAVIGAESTGKTSLCTELAAHFNDVWMPEYARQYVEKLDRPYTWNDVVHIASMQVKTEKEYLKKAQCVLFLDTDLVITKVWFEHVWKKCPDWVDRRIASAQRTIYLLCDNDLPWEYDPVRENPGIRDYLSEQYKSIIIKNNFPYFVVRGSEKKRTRHAIDKLKEIL